MLRILAVVALSMVVLSGCKPEIPDEMLLKCTATVADEFADGVDSNTPVAIEVKATDGYAPYSLLGSVGTFDETTSISKTFGNEEDEDITVNEVVIVKDSAGLTAQCSYSVVVHPVSTDPNPSVDVVGDPSLTAPNTATITIIATATGFGATPNFSFAYTQTGVSMSQSGHRATFSVTDGLAHSFDVTTTVSGEGHTATKTVRLVFTAPGALTCTLSHTSGTYHPYDIVPFTVTASTGETLLLTDGTTGTDGVATYVSNGTFGIAYSSTGTKTVTVKAQSLATGAKCNGGAVMTNTVTIQSALSCTAFTDAYEYAVWGYGSYYYGIRDSVIAWVNLPAGVAAGNVEITNVKATGNPSGSYRPYPYDSLAKEVFFYQSGLFQIEITVKDSTGSTATCTTPTIWVHY